MHRTALFLALLVAGCSEYDVQSGGYHPKGAQPDIELSTDALQFGPVDGGQTDVQAVTVTNVGGAPLTVKDLVITAGQDAFSVLTAPTEFVLDPDASAEVEVAFTPYLSTNFGSLSVLSDDPDEGEVTVDLLGIGNVPELAIDPQDYTFPSGCEDTVYVKLQNVGLAPLTITDLAFLGDPDLTLESQLTLPVDVPAGSEVGVTVRYVPVDQGGATAQLDVTSNDPRGVQTATQAGSPEVGQVTDAFTSLGDPPIDIVFALDKSGSMTEELGNLANAFDDFILEIDNVTQDWRIGVVSHDNGCFNNGIITPATPYYQDVFRDAVRGLQFFGTDLTEALLELTSVALWETVPGGCNQGFSRADAVLHIIAVSDEPEQSGTDWSVWVSQFQAAKADPALVVISSVVDLYNDCGSGADGYVQASDATGGLKLNICNSQWGTYAADLGNASAAALRTFHLSAVPDPATITVTVDGVTYPNGWTYDASINAVVVNVELPEGAQVEITYDAIGC